MIPNRGRAGFGNVGRGRGGGRGGGLGGIKKKKNIGFVPINLVKKATPYQVR